jgi:hypothetical protein
MTQCISGCLGAAGIKMMKVMKATSMMPSAPPAGEYSPPQNLRGFTWEQVMSTGMRARTVMMQMQMQMRWKKHRKPMKDEHRMWRTDMGTSDINCYVCEEYDDADTDAAEEASQADD